MGWRLPNFDYTRPYFYMVTIKRREGCPAFGRVVGDTALHYLECNAITYLFTDIIKTFHEKWSCLEPIDCFAIMPDHIHLLIKLQAVGKPVSLATIVWQLERRLEKAFFAEFGEGLLADGAANGATDRGGAAGSGATSSGSAVDRPVGQHLFEPEWHDWIVSKTGQLAAFKRYIRENAERSWLRHSHREYFQRVNEVEFLGRKWYGYGNAALLMLPVLEPFRCSRKWAEGGEEWNAAVARASRIGPGGAGVSTFMSPCEKACARALGLAGGRWIVLSPEGFGERWHPGRQYEKFCAEGRMLFLSLWPAMAREPTKAELYERCHLMGDVVTEALSGRMST